MYTSFFKLKKKPFETFTDTSFLWLGETHKEALATLKYGIINNMGFLLLTGNVGTGKTTLIKALIKSLPKNVAHSYISDPNFEPLDLFNYIVYSLNLKVEITSKSQFHVLFKKILLKAAGSKKKILLIIDEAQLLSDELLDQIRLLSNIDRDETNILNIFFIGQPEFNKTLVKEKNKAVRQRLSLNYNISPLNLKETTEYISYRLKIAGAENEIFSKSAVKKIHKASEGFPRRINIICDHCLLSGYVNENKIITGKIAKKCISELQLPGETKNKNRINEKGIKPAKKYAFYSTAAVIIFYLSFLSYDKLDYVTDFFPKKNISAQKVTLKKDDKEQFSKYESNIIKDNRVTKDEPENLERVQTEHPPGNEIKNNNSAEISQESIKEDIKDNESEILTEKSEKAQTEPAIKEKVLPFEEKKFILRFKYNTNEFEDSETEKIKKASEILTKYPDSNILITGYTDSAGYTKYNLKLSEFRANIVKGYLLGNGINGKRIKAVGKGQEEPVEANDTAWGRKMNRRVEMHIYQNSQAPE